MFEVDLTNFFGYPKVSFNQKKEKHEAENNNKREHGRTGYFEKRNKAESVCMGGN